MAINFYLTDVGKQAVVDQINLGLKLNLVSIVVGTGKYDASTSASSMKKLKNQVFQAKLSGGSTDTTTGNLKLIANLDSTLTIDIYEVGIIDSNGILFAVASTENSSLPILRLANNVTTIATFGLSFSNIDTSSISVNIDTNSPIAVSLMAQHLANADPHPQYLPRTDFATYINTTTPKIIGCGVVAGGNNDIDLSAISAIDDFRSNKYTVIVTPELENQTWRITRGEKKLSLSVWGSNGSSYSGNVSWLILQAYADDVPSGNGIYTSSGTYTIPVLAKERKLFQIAGGGGGGSISINSSSSSSVIDGTNGGDTTIVMGTTQILKATGGKGAQGGIWTNANTYRNGVGGDSGTVITYSSYAVNESKGGNAGIGTKDSQSGGVSVSSEGSYGAGGSGKSGIGDEGLAYGAGGGSGAYASIYYQNNTSTTQYITITVGGAGSGQDATANGTSGYARVQTVS